MDRDCDFVDVDNDKDARNYHFSVITLAETYYLKLM